MEEDTCRMAVDIINTAFPTSELRDRAGKYKNLSNEKLAELIQHDAPVVGDISEIKDYILETLSPGDSKRWYIIVCRYSMNTGQFVIRIGRYKLKPTGVSTWQARH